MDLSVRAFLLASLFYIVQIINFSEDVVVEAHKFSITQYLIFTLTKLLFLQTCFSLERWFLNRAFQKQLLEGFLSHQTCVRTIWVQWIIRWPRDIHKNFGILLVPKLYEDRRNRGKYKFCVVSPTNIAIMRKSDFPEYVCIAKTRLDAYS